MRYTPKRIQISTVPKRKHTALRIAWAVCVFAFFVGMTVKTYGHLLMLRAICLHSVPLAEMLVLAGAPLNTPDYKGRTPLIFAALHSDDNLPIIAMLLQHHANVNVENKRGFTALHRAVIADHVKTVKLLLAHHANPNTQCYTGRTPLFSAVMHKNIEIATALVLHGANTNTRDKKGYFPLDETVFIPGTKFATLLLEHHADVNAHDAAGWSVMHLATVAGRVDLVELFLKYGADINDRDSRFGDTPLIFAASSGNTKMVAFLLAHGADPTLKITTKRGEKRTALQVARLEHHANVVALLKNAKSVVNNPLTPASR